MPRKLENFREGASSTSDNQDVKENKNLRNNVNIVAGTGGTRGGENSGRNYVNIVAGTVRQQSKQYQYANNNSRHDDHAPPVNVVSLRKNMMLRTVQMSIRLAVEEFGVGRTAGEDQR